MKSNPVVGIIIPIYNVQSYLKECLDSVLNQTYRHLSIVLVDDGSTDDSSRIAQEYFQKDQRIVLIRQKNGGLSRARNVGLDYLQGKFEGVKFDENFSIQSHVATIPNVDFIHFLDSDDYFTLDCIESCVKVAQENDVDIVWHQFFQKNELQEGCAFTAEYDHIETDLPKNQIYSPEVIFQHRKTKHFSWAWCGLIQFEKLKNLRFIEGIEYEDICFGMMLFAQSQRIYLLDRCLMCYRIRPNSICQHTMHQKDFKPQYAPYMQELIDVFGNFQEAKKYSFFYSDCVNALEMEKFIQDRVKNRVLAKELREIVAFRCMVFVFNYQSRFASKDPKDCKTIIRQLQQYGYEPMSWKVLLELSKYSREHWFKRVLYRYPLIVLQGFFPSIYSRLKELYRRQIAFSFRNLFGSR